MTRWKWPSVVRCAAPLIAACAGCTALLDVGGLDFDSQGDAAGAARDADSGQAGGGSGGTSGAGSTTDGGGGTGGSSTVLPVSEGLTLWLDAMQGLDRGEGLIGRFADSSGNGNDAVQADPALQPRARTTSGGLPAVEFDGADDVLHLPAGFSDFSDGLTLLVVTRFTIPFWCMQFVHLSNGAETDEINLHAYKNGVLQFEVSDELLLSPEDSFVEDQPLLLSVLSTPADELTLFANGAGVASGSLSRPRSVERTQNLVGGGLYPACAPLDGLLFELLLYDRALMTDELELLTHHLQDKWRCCT